MPVVEDISLGDQPEALELVPIEVNAKFDAAAAIVAWLAYPNDSKKRKELGQAIMVRSRAAEICDPDQERWLKPSTYTVISRGIEKIVHHRHIAGLMAMQILSDGASSRTKLVEIFAQIGADMTRELRQRFERRPEHITSRIWSPTKPVMHMACVLPSLQFEFASKEMPYGDMYDLINTADWVARFMEQAARVREDIIACDRIKIEACDMIHLVDVSPLLPSSAPRKFL